MSANVFCSCHPEAAGPHGSSYCCAEVCKVSHKIIADVVPLPLLTSAASSVQVSEAPPHSVGRAGLMEQCGQHHGGSSLPDSSSSPRSFYRCLPVGLGSPRSGTDCGRHVPGKSSHKCTRADGNLLGPAVLPASAALVLMDNTTALSYVNWQGGTVSRSLCHLALDLWKWYQEHRIYVVAAHVPGLQNVTADHLSRGHLSLHKWELHWTYLKPVFRRWGFPDIDVFAPQSNK